MMQQHQPRPVPLQSQTVVNPSRSTGPLRHLRKNPDLGCRSHRAPPPLPPICPMLRLTALILQRSSFPALIAKPSSMLELLLLARGN
ncbi:hypothetical protein TB1_007854 [Malus domestica]